MQLRLHPPNRDCLVLFHIPAFVHIVCVVLLCVCCFMRICLFQFGHWGQLPVNWHTRHGAQPEGRRDMAVTQERWST